MNRPTFILVLCALFALGYTAAVSRPTASLHTAARQDDDFDFSDDEFQGGGEEEFPEFDQQFDETQYEADILKDTAPKPKTKPPAPKPDPKPSKVTKAPAAGGAKPASCACKKGPKNANSKCYYYTDEKNKYCKSRPCEPSYMCAKGGSTTCIRKKNTKKVEHVGGNTCKTVPISEYAYAPYST